MPEQSPLVTTCILSYENAQFLPAAIESVLAQSYKNHEIIIVDDGSSDTSLDIARSFQKEHSDRIRVYTHEKQQNLGISATCNLGLAKANGEFISWMGSDDMLLPGKIETQVKILIENTNVGIVYSKARLIDEAGVKSNVFIGGKYNDKHSPLYQILRLNLIPAPTVLCRTECFNMLGNFDERLVYSDWEMWLRILAHWDLEFVDRATVLYRVHKKNTSLGIKAELDSQRKLRVVKKLHEESPSIGGRFSSQEVQDLLQRKPAQILKEESLCHLNNYFLSCQSGEIKEAITHLLSAIRKSPTRVLTPRRIGAILKRFILAIPSFKTN